MMILLFFAFLSGIVTILSPCILPVLPIVLSGAVGGKRRPLGVITGFIASFSIFTLLLSTLVKVLNIPPDTLRYSAVVLLVLFGTVMIAPPLRNRFELLASRLTGRKGTGKQRTGFTGGVLTGASLGLVWTPCVGPIMASVISLAITRNVDGGSVLIILAYSFGTAIPMFAVMTGGRKLIGRFPALTGNPEKLLKIFGTLMIMVGLSIGFGLDRRFQSAVLTLFPGYGTGLTAFENSDAVQSVLKQRNREPLQVGEKQLTSDDEPRGARLGDYGLAPGIVTSGPWFNTEGRELTMEDLKGKVVLVDFWTYSCVNCIRTIPHLKAWYEAYKDKGFVILGVHTPEFAFEAKPENVARAMADLGVTWPVVLDNDFRQWRAYRNRYWPAHYFIDTEGRIRYFSFGEGHYEDSEKVIRKLLDEAGRKVNTKAAGVEAAVLQSRTPETYLGYGRAAGFKSPGALQKDSEQMYSPAPSLENGEWSLDGNWTFTEEYILSGDGAVLNLSFHARHVYLVIEKADEDGWLEVLNDGTAVNETGDVVRGLLKVDDSRLYELVSLPEAGPHSLTLKIHGRLKLFAFTFG